MSRLPIVALALVSFLFCVPNRSHAQEIKPENIWVLENDVITARFGYSNSRPFGLLDIKEKRFGKIWTVPESNDGLVWFLLKDRALANEMAKYRVLSHSISDLSRGGKKHSFVLSWGTFDSVIFSCELYPGQPFLRTYYSYNPAAPFVSGNEARFFVSSADLLNWSFETGNSKHRSLHLNQWWRPETGKGNFDIIKTVLNPGSAAQIKSGAYGKHCSWFAIRETGTDHGIVAGWEFNGRADAYVGLSPIGKLRLRVYLDPVNWVVPTGENFESPASFIGFFRGDWDEAGHVTRNFVESVLMKPLPPGFKFPDAMFDSWGYGTTYGKDTWGEDISEEKMRRAAEIAASLGAEVFTVDLGWSRLIGDWHDDRRKFPSGLRALSDYVHSLGMKFGLHIALLEAHVDSPALKENDDWRASRGNGYFGADSLCPAHWPVKEWLIREITRVIREYNVDWVLQDGENMVKVCEKTSHAHHPQGSNYANAIALDEIVSRVQRATPNTVWENCEDGGNMMTYQMVQNYHTSIHEDATGSLPARQALYGVTHAFPGRYTLGYMPEQNPTAYDFRSYMPGRPIVLMQKITEWSKEQIRLAKQELDLYRSLRQKMNGAKFYHLLEQPDGKRNDAIQVHNEKLDWSVIFVYRTEGGQDKQSIKPRGLQNGVVYKIRFQNDPRTLFATGKKIMSDGLDANLPEHYVAEIIYIEAISKPHILLRFYRLGCKRFRIPRNSITIPRHSSPFSLDPVKSRHERGFEDDLIDKKSTADGRISTGSLRGCLKDNLRRKTHQDYPLFLKWIPFCLFFPVSL